MRRWIGAAVAALALTVAAAPGALGATGAPAPRPAVGGSTTELHPSDTAPSSVWSAARVGAGLRTAWTAPDVNQVYAETAGATLVLDDSDNLTALSTTTGAKLWSIPAPGTVSAVSAANGRFFASFINPGEILALNAATGATVWTIPAAQPSSVSPFGSVLLQSFADSTASQGEVAALDPATGHAIWTQTGMDIVNGAAGKVYGITRLFPSPGHPNGAVFGLNPTTGAILWSSDYPAGFFGEVGEALSSGRFWLRFAPQDPNSTAAQFDRAYDGTTGAIAWTQPLFDSGINPFLLPESVGGIGYQPGSNDHLWAINEATGHAQWVGSIGLPLTQGTAVGPGAVLVGCGQPDENGEQDFVCGFDRSNGAPLGATYVGPLDAATETWLLAGNDLIVESNGGVTALTPAALLPVPGKIQAESTISPAPRGPANDAGGGQLVGLFPPGGTVLDYPVNIATAGTYTVTFRVASDGAHLSPPISPQLQLQVIGTGTVASVNVPQTGGWQSWQSVTATATLPAGVHRLRIYIPAGHQAFNLNWFDVEHSTTAAARTAATVPTTTATQRQSACLAGLKPSTQLTKAAIAADCAVS